MFSTCKTVGELKAFLTTVPNNLPINLTSLSTRIGLDCTIVRSKKPFVRFYEAGKLKQGN